MRSILYLLLGVLTPLTFANDADRALRFVYHVKPKQMRGPLLYPLNSLKHVYPDVYEAAKAKYAGREDVLNRQVPGTRWLWNDFVFASPIHPSKVYVALKEASQGVLPDFDEFYPPDLEWFEIPLEAISRVPVYWYAYSGDETNPREFAPLREVDPQQIDRIPAATYGYYCDSFGMNQRPLLFHRIPHVMIAGAIDTCSHRIATVTWGPSTISPP